MLSAATITAAPKIKRIAYSCLVIFLPFILLCNHNAIKMQSTQAKNTHYNRKIAFWHFVSRQPRRDQLISRCNQNAIITRSIARRCCIASNFARRCSYPDKTNQLNIRLNFARGKIASLPAKIFAALLHFLRGLAALTMPRCRKSTGKK